MLGVQHTFPALQTDVSGPKEVPNTEMLKLLRALATRSELAAVLRTTPENLREILHGHSNNRDRHYRTFQIRKRSGGSRTIHAPRKTLKALQHELKIVLESIYRPRSCVMGYIAERSILDNARIHQGARWVLRVDIESFFPSIHFGRVLGMFKAMGIQHEVAVAMAQLSCTSEHLPQGAPTSPVVSNLMCGRLDRQLAGLARLHKLRYTRYCDDLVFSTDKKRFPDAVFRHSTAKVGDRLRRSLSESGFSINESKIRIMPKWERQMVTGLTVNRLANTPRKFIREVRGLIYMCTRYGFKSTEAYFHRYMDMRNRPNRTDPPNIKKVIRGRLSHIAWIKGPQDPTFQNLARKYASIDVGYTPPSPGLSPLRIICEGPSDVTHLKATLEALRDLPNLSELEVTLDHKGGDGNLIKAIRELKNESLSTATICLFDRDSDRVVKKVEGSGTFKAWSDDLFSMAIPKPNHRQALDRICIEHLYTDRDLRVESNEGMRLYLSSEFSAAGWNSEDKAHWKHPKANLVAEDVYSGDTRVGLTKTGFADFKKARMETGAPVELGGFRKLWDALTEIAAIHHANRKSRNVVT